MRSFNPSLDTIWLIFPLIFILANVENIAKSQKWVFWLKSGICLILLFIPIYFNTRALLFGCLLSIQYFLRWNYKLDKFRIALGIIFLFGIITLWKSASTFSRIHIWNISGKILDKYWLLGLGSTPFNVAFNHEQAEWFARQSSLNNQFGLLANDGYYAFNDWLQFSIEYGILGISASIIFLVGFSLLLIKSRKNKISLWQNYFIGSLIPILTLSMVSYPLHKEPILAITLILVWLILCNLYFSTSFSEKYSSLALSIRVTGLAVITIFFGCRFWINAKFQKIYSMAVYEWKTGNRAESSKIMEKIPADVIVSKHPFAVTKAYWLWQMDSVPKAIHLLESHHQFHCNQRNHTLLGRWYNETGDFVSSERHFLLALHITPHLLESRFDLMKLYSKWDKKEKASYWARELIEFPIKVQNERADYLKNEAMKFLATGKQAL